MKNLFNHYVKNEYENKNDEIKSSLSPKFKKLNNFTKLNPNKRDTTQSKIKTIYPKLKETNQLSDIINARKDTNAKLFQIRNSKNQTILPKSNSQIIVQNQIGLESKSHPHEELRRSIMKLNQDVYNKYFSILMDTNNFNKRQNLVDLGVTDKKEHKSLKAPNNSSLIKIQNYFHTRLIHKKKHNLEYMNRKSLKGKIAKALGYTKKICSKFKHNINYINKLLVEFIERYSEEFENNRLSSLSAYSQNEMKISLKNIEKYYFNINKLEKEEENQREILKKHLTTKEYNYVIQNPTVFGKLYQDCWTTESLLNKIKIELNETIVKLPKQSEKFPIFDSLKEYVFRDVKKKKKKKIIKESKEEMLKKEIHKNEKIIEKILNINNYKKKPVSVLGGYNKDNPKYNIKYSIGKKDSPKHFEGFKKLIADQGLILDIKTKNNIFKTNSIINNESSSSNTKISFSNSTLFKKNMKINSPINNSKKLLNNNFSRKHEYALKSIERKYRLEEQSSCNILKFKVNSNNINSKEYSMMKGLIDNNINPYVIKVVKSNLVK